MLISVVIPTFQRPESLRRCLELIGKQTLPREDFEVIVTDDSPDSTSHDMVREAFPWVQWTQGPKKGPAANRNHGASESKGEWIAFVDDDCEPVIGWLAAICSQREVDVVEGKTVCPSERDTPFEEKVENLRGGVFWSCNLAVRRLVFVRLGGFDEDFLEAGGEDMEFAWRIAGNRLRTRFVPGALVEHPPRPLTWKQLWWRTWLIRWMALYLLKTGQSAPLKASLPVYLFAVVKRELAYLLRTTAHLFLKPDPKRWRTRLFFQAWKWATFPLVLPYLMLWEIRFRKSLSARS
jgi:GT2 family glycosyltransferase